MLGVWLGTGFRGFRLERACAKGDGLVGGRHGIPALQRSEAGLDNDDVVEHLHSEASLHVRKFYNFC
jgi:hypothetical protein